VAPDNEEHGSTVAGVSHFRHLTSARRHGVVE
jgi:hypothetical protein